MFSTTHITGTVILAQLPSVVFPPFIVDMMTILDLKDGLWLGWSAVGKDCPEDQGFKRHVNMGCTFVYIYTCSFLILSADVLTKVF